MTPGEFSTERSEVPCPALRELETLLALWKMTGHAPAALPSHRLFKRALWEENELRAREGRRLRLPLGDAARAYEDPPDDHVGVRAFA